MRGDLQLSAIGTVTWRDGDRVLLFGHPLFQAGGVRLPLSTASIVTVVASDYSSFKLGARGREVGVVTQDRRAGVTGAIGPRASLLPLTVAIEGLRPAPQRFRFEMVEDRALRPGAGRHRHAEQPARGGRHRRQPDARAGPCGSTGAGPNRSPSRTSPPARPRPAMSPTA